MSGSAPTLPPAAWAVALSSLPELGPARFQALAARWSFEECWRRVATGALATDALAALSCGRDPRRLADLWRSAADRTDVAQLWHAHAVAGIDVLVGDDLPPDLADDLDPPVVAFVVGDLASTLRGPRVAIVGTRRCTHTGREVARRLGADLAAAGVTVVSGLALGIDGAAHAGALAVGGAPPLAVVGSGLDVPYPRRHAELWEAVAAAGAVLSEAPLGAAPERWRFPARNRLIAALSDVVVVVESRAAGGSLHTVRSSLERDRTVMAVPGSVRSPASAGTNQLLVDGAAPARDATDVLVALGLTGRTAAVAPRQTPPGPTLPLGPALEADASLVLEAVGWEPVRLEEVAGRLGEPLGPVAVHLTKLEQAGLVRRQGAWWERC